MSLDLPFIFEPKPSLNPKGYGGLSIFDANNIDRFTEFGFHIVKAAPHGLIIRASYTFPGPVQQNYVLGWARINLRRVEPWTSPGHQKIEFRISQSVNVDHIPIRLHDFFDTVGVRYVDEITSPFLWMYGTVSPHLYFVTEDLATGGTVTIGGNAYVYRLKGFQIFNF